MGVLIGSKARHRICRSRGGAICRLRRATGSAPAAAWWGNATRPHSPAKHLFSREYGCRPSFPPPPLPTLPQHASCAFLSAAPRATTSHLPAPLPRTTYAIFFFLLCCDRLQFLPLVLHGASKNGNLFLLPHYAPAAVQKDALLLIGCDVTRNEYADEVIPTCAMLISRYVLARMVLLSAVVLAVTSESALRKQVL